VITPALHVIRDDFCGMLATNELREVCDRSTIGPARLLGDRLVDEWCSRAWIEPPGGDGFPLQ
jgi:hypothetical protein